jgi:hypothetical protein
MLTGQQAGQDWVPAAMHWKHTTLIFHYMSGTLLHEYYIPQQTQIKDLESFFKLLKKQ